MTDDEIVNENNAIAKEYKELLKISYRTLSTKDKKLIRKAFDVAVDAHSEQRRKSGEAYIFHPLAVAKIVAQEIGLDATSIAAALLHDVVEDSPDYEIKDIEKRFGKTIATIVDGLTKISSLSKEKDMDVSLQAENFRKMLLTLNDDVRVIIIKIADRLHNMRTLHHIQKSEKRSRIARETLDIYAPLAERIGMQELMNELESLSFPHVYPEAYESIMKRLDYLHDNTENIRDEVINELEKIFLKNHLEVEVVGRRKQPYSIWKMLREMKSPEMKSALGFMVAFMKNLSKQNIQSTKN